MKASDYITEFLRRMGVTHLFGYPGGAVTHIIDSVYKAHGIAFIGMGSEQGAAFAAEGYARAGQRLGAAIATSGPGAANLITGIGSAYFDSVPVIYITGQVNTYEYKSSFSETRNIRQLGFQETDIVEIVKPITKYAVRAADAALLPEILAKAAEKALTGRQGPVLVDIPMNIQRADIPEDIILPELSAPDYNINTNEIISLINSARRPCMLIGGGCRLKENSGLSAILKATRMPVVASLMGLERFNFEYGNFLGLMGAYGSRFANKTVASSDLLITLGSRLDNRQTAARAGFAKSARLIRVDIDKNEFEYKVKPDEIQVSCDCQSFVKALSKESEKLCRVPEEWIDEVTGLREKYPVAKEREMKLPSELMSSIAGCCDKNTVVSVDVGQNQIWAAQSLKTERLYKFMTSGGMGAMGFSLPAAIGASFALPGKKILSINGDGGINMNIQELHSVKRYRLPVNIIVLNNRALGMIRHFQEMYFDSLYAGTVIDYDTPDFEKLGGAYGIASYKLPADFEAQTLKDIIDREGASLCEITLPQTTYIFPKLAVGKPIEEQE